MKLHISVKGQDSSLIFAKGYPDFKIKTCFSQKLLSHLKPDFTGKLLGAVEMKTYTNGIGHMTKMAALPNYGKYL